MTPVVRFRIEDDMIARLDRLFPGTASRIVFRETATPVSHMRYTGATDGTGYGLAATTVTLAYLWLPYMILPIYAGLERIPDSLLEASADLGARAGSTFRRVILPLTLPAVVAGSIFTFSLTLGDYVTPSLVAGGTQFIGNIVFENIGVVGNTPLAAAYACVPILVMIVYLVLARRTGAFESL